MKGAAPTSIILAMLFAFGFVPVPPADAGQTEGKPPIWDIIVDGKSPLWATNQPHNNLIRTNNLSEGRTGLERGEIVIHEIDISNFLQVTLYLSGPDPAGQRIVGLKAPDFKVAEDEVEQSSIHLETRLPSVATALVANPAPEIGQASVEATCSTMSLHPDGERTSSESKAYLLAPPRPTTCSIELGSGFG